MAGLPARGDRREGCFQHLSLRSLCLVLASFQQGNEPLFAFRIGPPRGLVIRDRDRHRRLDLQGATELALDHRRIWRRRPAGVRDGIQQGLELPVGKAAGHGFGLPHLACRRLRFPGRIQGAHSAAICRALDRLDPLADRRAIRGADLSQLREVPGVASDQDLLARIVEEAVLRLLAAIGPLLDINLP